MAQVLLASMCLQLLYDDAGRGKGKGETVDAPERALRRVSRVLFLLANGATLAFGATYYAVNVKAMKELTGMEAVFETLAVVAQLLFMGTLSAHMRLLTARNTSSVNAFKQ